MANTFKVKTKASVSNSSLDTIYTVPSSTSTVVLGMALSNKTTSAITADVQLVSNTADTETNADVRRPLISGLPWHQSEHRHDRGCVELGRLVKERSPLGQQREELSAK